MANETAAQTLQAIKDTLYARATGTAMESYVLPDGREAQFIPSTELRQLLLKYEQLVSEDSTASNGSTRAYASFRRPR